MATLFRDFCMVMVMLGSCAAFGQDNVAIEREDLDLWQAAIQGKSYHNRVSIAPQTVSDHVEITSRSLNQPMPADRHTLSEAIVIQDTLVDQFIRNTGLEQQAIKELPEAWTTTAKAISWRVLFNKRPGLRELAQSDPPGGVIGLVDHYRRSQTGSYLNQMALRYVSSDIAHLVDEKYRSLLGPHRDRQPLQLVIDQAPDEVGVYVPDRKGSRLRIGATMARISHTGDRALENVVVVTHAAMRPIDFENRAVRALINVINESVIPGLPQNADADKYVLATQLMHAAPQGAVAYFKRVEPGDVLYVCLYLQGSFWNIQEAKVSVYATSGALLDQVLMTGGPHNDLNASAEEQKRDAAVRVVKTTGPIFKPVPLHERLELTIKPTPDGAPAMFDVCVPSQLSFISLGKSVPLTIPQPITAIAQSPTHYAAVGLKRDVGNGLVLVPKTSVAKTTTIDERNEEELAAARENEARAKEQLEEQAFQKRISKLSPERQIEETMKRNNEKLRQALAPKNVPDKGKSKTAKPNAKPVR